MATLAPSRCWLKGLDGGSFCTTKLAVSRDLGLGVLSYSGVDQSLKGANGIVDLDLFTI